MIHLTERLAAAFFAVAVTLSIVWGMANLGYPQQTTAAMAARFGACYPDTV
jgi:hypothetical protein